MDLNKIKNEKGITLIALAVTIVVLLILAGVSLNAVFSQNGIISKAQDAQNKMNDAENSDLAAIDSLNNEIDKLVNGNDTSKPFVTDESLTSETRTVTESSTVIAQDTLGNQVVVPGGFRIAADSGSTVKEGIVIEDAEGNQFVWVPVSNINGDGSNKIKVDENTEVEITLGRYTFDETDGTETIVQKGSEFARTTSTNVVDGTVDTAFSIEGTYELSDYRESNGKSGTDATNTTAKDLKGFIEKTRDNKGYYIARYEASYGSGYDESGSTEAEKYANAKPLSKVSTVCNGSQGSQLTTGQLWNYINQGNAAKVSQNMYSGNSYVKSDLINSYAWDTAIVYIQNMGNDNYANQNNGPKSWSVMNTGLTEDEKCKIFDMSGNAMEITTEYNTYVNEDYGYLLCCTSRGGKCNPSHCYTSTRGSSTVDSSDFSFCFRTLLYVN